MEGRKITSAAQRKAVKQDRNIILLALVLGGAIVLTAWLYF